MGIEAAITFIILGAAVVLLLSDRVRPDLVALLVMLSLGLSGVITVQQTFSGFSRSAVITILAIFVLADGLRRSGVTEYLGNWLLRLGGNNEIRLTMALTIAGAVLSLFMNNIAAAAVLLPAVMGTSRKTSVSPSRLLIPLAFGTILGGMATLFTTTNIVASSLLQDQGLAGFGVFDFAPLGLFVVAAGVVYMAVVGRRLLPVHPPHQRLGIAPQIENDLAEVYRLKERVMRARLPANSPLVGKNLDQCGLREAYHLNVVAIERNGHGVLAPTAQAVIRPDDILLLAGRFQKNSAQAFEPLFRLAPAKRISETDLESEGVVMVEAVLAPRSRLIGKTLRQVHFRVKYDMSVVAIWRAGRPIRTGLSDLALQFGDALLLLGPRSSLKLLHSETDLILLSDVQRPSPVSRRKTWLAVGIMGLSILFAGLFNDAIGEIMLAGAVVMVLAGILSMDDAYQAIEWKSIFVIAGMLPLGVALMETGAAQTLGNWVINLAGSAGPQVLLALLTLLTVLLTQVMSGSAVAAIMVPVAIGAANQMGAAPRAFTMGIALATSLAFVTPFGHPVNILVMGPGGYQIKDYLRVGLPLAILLLLLIIGLLPVFWPV